MKSKINVKKTLLVFLALFIIIIALDVIFFSSDYFEGNYFKMDTHISVRGDGKNMDFATRDILRAIDDVDSNMNANSVHSKLYKLNNITNNGIEIDKKFEELLRLADDLKTKSGGAFNIAIKPVIDLWGFNGDFKKVPTNDEIKTALETVNNTKINIESEKISLNHGKIDLGGIAKGYVSDLSREILKKYNINYAIIDFGGNILTYGKKSGNSPFKIAISDGNKGSVGYLTVGETCVITSGGYERYFEENGQKYHHIIDPSTGYPASSGLFSVTIISSNGALADGLSTACFVLGLNKGMELVNEYGVDAVFIDNNKKIYITKGAKFTVTAPDYEIINNG